MKKMHTRTLGLLALATLILASCSSGHYYAGPPPYRNSISLIITPSPGFRMDRYRDGRLFYRSPDGFVYWRGNDNRFYLDRGAVHRGYYSSREYNEWKRYGRRNYRHY